MIERGLIITGSDAELLSNALSEVKTNPMKNPRLNQMMLRHSMRSFRPSGASGVPRMMDRKKKEVTRILAPYVSAWCQARLSTGAKALNAARPDRCRFVPADVNLYFLFVEEEKASFQTIFYRMCLKQGSWYVVSDTSDTSDTSLTSGGKCKVIRRCCNYIW